MAKNTNVVMNDEVLRPRTACDDAWHPGRLAERPTNSGHYRIAVNGSTHSTQSAGIQTRPPVKAKPAAPKTNPAK